MTAVAGRRMAETVARRGGLTVLAPGHPARRRRLGRRLRQEPPPAVRDGDHAVAAPHDRRRPRPHPQASHGAVVVVDEGGAPLGVFSEHDAAGYDRFTQLHAAVSREVVTVADGIDAVTAFELLTAQRRLARAGGRRRGPADRRDDPQRRTALDDLPPARRRRRPADDRRRRRDQRSGAGEGIDVKAKALREMGVDVLVIDTAHGHQERTPAAVEAVSLTSTPRSSPATSSPPRAPASSSMPAPTSSRSVSVRERCAPPG